MTCSINDMELEEEEPSTVCVMWIEVFDWIASTSCDVVSLTLAEGGLGC